MANAAVVLGGPLQQSEIGVDAKWLVHVDMENLMQSSFSDIGVEKLKEAIKEHNESSVSIDVDMVLEEIKSITAYGSEFKEDDVDGVIILKTGDRLQTIFDGLIAHYEMENEGEMPMKRLEDKPYETYVFEDELFLAFPNKNVAIASKSFDRIENAFAVVQGEGPNLSDSKEKLVVNDEAGFFLMVTATGINALENIPPQARMLQKTKGGQFSLGENEGTLRANLVLTTSGKEVSLQLYRIVQGMIALASFTQVENHSMMELMDSIDVRQGDDFVSLDFQYPTERLMSLIETLSGNGHNADHKPEGHSARGDDDCRNQIELLAQVLPAAGVGVWKAPDSYHD